MVSTPAEGKQGHNQPSRHTPGTLKPLQPSLSVLRHHQYDVITLPLLPWPHCHHPHLLGEVSQRM